jgi:hypothetical protein
MPVRYFAGVITCLDETDHNCNVTLVVPTVGGVDKITCQNVREMYHAEDAFRALDQLEKNPYKLKDGMAFCNPPPQVIA